MRNRPDQEKVAETKRVLAETKGPASAAWAAVAETKPGLAETLVDRRRGPRVRAAQPSPLSVASSAAWAAAWRRGKILFSTALGPGAREQTATDLRRSDRPSHRLVLELLRPI